MAELSCLLLALLLTASLCPAQELAKPEPIKGEEGKEVTFSLKYSGPRTEVVWKIGEDKLVEVDKNEALYYRLKGRASVTFNPGDLTIHVLEASDSGNYRGSYLQDGKYHETEFTLKVSPSKPDMNYTEIDQKVKLHCHSTSTGVTYQWINSSGEILSSGPNHEIDRKKGTTNESLTCIVKNQHADISNTLTIILPPQPDPPTPVWIIVIAIVLPIVIVGGVVVVIYKKRLFLGKICKDDKRVSVDKLEKPAESELLYQDGDAADNGKTPGKSEGE